MLFGKILKQSTPYVYNHNVPEIEEIGPVLAIHNVALSGQNLGQTSLWVKKQGQEFLVTVLNKDKLQTMVELNLYIYDNVELIVKGPGTMHLIGSFEMGREEIEGDQGLYGDQEDIFDDDFNNADYSQDNQQENQSIDQQQQIFNLNLNNNNNNNKPSPSFSAQNPKSFNKNFIKK